MTGDDAQDLAALADALFREGLDWLVQSWPEHGFFVERDVAWTLQRWLARQCTVRAKGLTVRHEHRMAPRVSADLVIVPQAEETVLLAAELKYEPAKTRTDIAKKKLPVTTWPEIRRDIERARAYVESGLCDVAYSVLFDEGGRYPDTRIAEPAQWREESGAAPVHLLVARFPGRGGP